MVTELRPPRGARRRDPGAREAGRRDRRRGRDAARRASSRPFDREDIHELVAHLDDVVDGIQAIAETFMIYDITQPTDEARRLAGILAAQAVQLLEALGQARSSRASSPTSQVHELENKAEACRAPAIGAAVPGRARPARGHQVARHLHGARGHDRRRRGRGRGHRADRRQERLSGPSADAGRLSACGRASCRPRSAAAPGDPLVVRRWSR